MDAACIGGVESAADPSQVKTPTFAAPCSRIRVANLGCFSLRRAASRLIGRDFIFSPNASPRPEPCPWREAQSPDPAAQRLAVVHDVPLFQILEQKVLPSHGARPMFVNVTEYG